MSKKTIIYGLFILVLSVGLAACERSATTVTVAPTTDATEANATNQDPMAMLRAFATQTAQAMSGTIQPAVPTSGTPQPANTPLNLPTAEPTKKPVVKTAVPPNDTKPATYTLQEGEFPYCIARRFNVNPIELLTLNGLGGGGQYVPGLVLKIPQNNNTWPKSEPRSLLKRPVESYKVANGETIYTIACKFGDIDPLTIAEANDLVAPYRLKINQVIRIP